LLRDRRFFKPVLALTAVTAVAVIVSGCAFVKPGSLTTSQPQGIGSVRVHFDFCTIGDTETENEFCGKVEDAETRQYLAGIAVPPGSTPPASFTATSTDGGAPIQFTRSDEVAAELAAASAALQKGVSEMSPEDKAEFEKAKEIIGSAWPPNGLQGVGYLSAPVAEVKEQKTEWSADLDFGLPATTDGGPFPGPFTTAIAWGTRGVFEGAPSTRPVHCFRFAPKAMIEEEEALCFGALQQVAPITADLKIIAPKTPAPAFVGGKGELSFPLKFAGPTGTVPIFTLSATTTAKGAKTKLAPSAFTPSTPDATTHLAPTGTGKVTVTLPRNAKPKTYTVTLTATTPQGGTATQVAKLKVTKPKLKFGAAKIDAAKGTATLKVTVPGAGTLTIKGKGVKTVKTKAKKKKTLKVKISSTGSTSALLGSAGSAKVKAKATFKPTSGISVTKTRPIVLKLR
jgi:hypothetical protein